jgi:hypothetical protein
MSHLDRLKAKERPAGASETPAGPDSDQQARPGTELPRFAIRADYDACLVALLFDPDDIAALTAHPLFASQAELLRAAAMDCEQEIEARILSARDRQITGRY